VIGGKGMSIHKPTALGTLMQAATYGMTIPTIYGTTQSALLAIWAANFRKGHCRGKKGKNKKKKSPPQFLENIDMLIGSNPIEGVLQVWENADKWPLNFLKYDYAVPASTRTVVIPDAHFYHLIAVTIDVLNAGNFNDYGSPYLGMISAGVLRDPGSGYAVNDTFTVNGGTVLAIGHVTSVSGGGAVTGIAIDTVGTGYSIGSHIPTTATSGTGSGMTVDISAVGPAYSDTSEYPLWNTVQHGPDLIDAGYAKYYPNVYQWAPSDGASVFFPFVMNFFGGFTAHFYYAQLSSVIKRQVPLTRSCLTFEPVLGDGTEYAVAPAQQILYPEYAGCGSAHIDLGTSGAIPSVKPEVVGAFKRYAPRGDADFADMIEDTIKSGMLQVGSQLGLIQRGVNCNELPGAVQKMQYFQLEPTDDTSAVLAGFQQPIKAGDVLCAFVRWRYGSGGAGSGMPVPTISDDAANTWIPIFDTSTGMYGGFWYAIASADWPARNNIHAIWNGTGGFSYDVECSCWVMDHGSGTVDNTAQASGTGAVASCSIAVTGAPTYIAVALDIEGSTTLASQAIPPHWNLLFPTMNNGSCAVAYRIVSAPGTYTFKSNALALSPGWQIGMIALKATQPVPYPKALGNILDGVSLENVRAMCQAGGLFGSVTMNSQRSASDWLKEFYQCANAAPVWSGFKLKSIARSEVSAVGNGRVYIAPTAAGPVATLTESDLVGDSSKPLISVERKAQVDANNILQVQYFDRNADYNPSVASEPLSGAIALFGPRKESPVTLPEIQDPSVARKVLAIEVRRRTLLRNMYKFTGKAHLIGFEAMDVIRINESKIGITKLAVRLTKVTENDNFELEMEAEPFIYGCHAPNDLPTTVLSPFAPSSGGDPGSVNAPIIFEPVPRLTSQQNQAQLWLVVSAPNAAYGGCAVLISTDGGASYNAIGTIYGSAVTGLTVGDWPAANDPDTTNDLSVDLTESLGSLDTYAPADRDNFVYPCYVAGGAAPDVQAGTSYAVTGADANKVIQLTNSAAIAVSLPNANTLPAGFTVTIVSTGTPGNLIGIATATPTGCLIEGHASIRIDGSTGSYFYFGLVITGDGTNYSAKPLTIMQVASLVGTLTPYELMTYDIATLTAAYKYTPATGGGTNELRRAVFGAPMLGSGVDHPNGSRFAFLDPSGLGILKLNFDPSWTGKTLKFKFLAFNLFGNDLQDQSAATAYSYSPTGGTTGGQNPSTTTYSIVGGALTQPTPTSIAMAQATAQFPSNAANYNARTFAIPTPSAPTTYYVTILDPAQLGDTGTATNLSAYCEADASKQGTPGYIYIGSIVALPAGGGTTTGGGGSTPGGGATGDEILINGA
jgi:Putative phage tail protein